MKEIDALVATQPEVVADFYDFWTDIVMPDGRLDLAQVARELYDYHMIMQEVTRVYEHVTGGRITKPNAHASAVIEMADDFYSQWFAPDDEETVFDRLAMEADLNRNRYEDTP